MSDTVDNPTPCFQKLYLVFELSHETGYETLDLCDIFTTKERANRDKTERENKLGKTMCKYWGISFQVSEWEVQE